MKEAGKNDLPRIFWKIAYLVTVTVVRSIQDRIIWFLKHSFLVKNVF